MITHQITVQRRTSQQKQVFLTKRIKQQLPRTRYILNKSALYYTTGHLELYEYNMKTGESTLVDEQVSGAL